MTKKHMHVKVDEILLTNFDNACRQHGLDRSEVIRNLMFGFVNKYKEVEKMRGLLKMNEKEFAKELGFTDYSDLCEKSEIVYEEPGDITWYVTELSDGRWAAWDDVEISLHRVAYFDSRDEAVAFQQSGMEIAEASEQKKFILNLKDEGGIRTGYEQKLEGDTKEEVMQDYLHYLNHECNMIEDGELTEADVDCEEVDWE